MILVYDSITGETMRLSKRFDTPSMDLKNFVKTENKILLIGRRLLKDESLWELSNFINKNKKSIIGVIIYDDKMNGEEFGESSVFYSSQGIKVLALWDKIISDEEIKEMESDLNELI